MSTTAILSGYTHHIDSGAVPIIGRLFWYSVHQHCIVEFDEFVDRLRAEGLEELAPAKPKDDDVFLTLSSKAQRKREPIPGEEGVFENFLVRKVAHTPTQIVKQIVVERVDGGNKRLSYSAKVELMFLKTTGELVVSEIGWPSHPRATALANDVKAEYESRKGKLGDAAVRSFLNRAITIERAARVKETGGVYFMLAHRCSVLSALQRILDGIDGATLDTVPLIDDGDQREMIRRAFIEESVGAATKLAGVMAELLSGDAITPRRFAALNAEAEEIQAKVNEYADLLKISSETTDLRLQALSPPVPPHEGLT